MKKFAIPTLAAALALGACAEANAPADEADDAATTTTVVEPAETTTIVEEPVPADGMDDTDGSSLTIDGQDVDATVTEEGVDAKVNVD